MLAQIQSYFIIQAISLFLVFLANSCGKNPDLEKNTQETSSPEIDNTSTVDEGSKTNTDNENKTETSTDTNTQPKSKENQTLSQAPESSPKTNSASNDTEQILKEGEGVVSSSGKYRMHIQWESPLIAKKDLKAKITFSDISGLKKPSVNIASFDPIMVRMGHGTSKTRLKFNPAPEGPHCFNATGIYFSMGELWTITVIAKIEDQFENFAIDVTLP